MRKLRIFGVLSRRRPDSALFLSKKPFTGFIPRSKRGQLLMGLLGMVLVMLMGRMFFLQAVKGAYYANVSEKNRIRRLTLPASRGQVMDRKGRIIADNRPSYTVFLIPYEVSEALPKGRSRAGGAGFSSMVSRLATCLQVDSSYLEEKLTSKRFRGYEPIRLKKDIDFNTVCVVEERNQDLPGVMYQVEPVRRYPEGGWVGHVVGYVNELTKEELLQGATQRGFRLGGVIGRKALEKQYDDMLRGNDGVTYLEVTAKGKILGPLEERKPDRPVNGSDLWLTVDLDLQTAAESALVDHEAAAVVALDPRTGQILALVSKPGLHSNLFAGAMSPQEWNDILEDPLHPLLTRPIQATYPPGSTLKLLTAAIALETGVARKNTYFSSCLGSFRFGRRTFGCWQPEGHGRLNLEHAIIQSCDVYFYQLGLKVGLERWSRYAQLCGFGRKTGLDIPEEANGLVPTLKYYRKMYGKGEWVKNLVINLSIGQGEILVTPLQMAVFFGALATDGRLTQPYLVKKIVTADGRILPHEPEFAGYLPFSASTLRIVQKAMTGVVNNTHGTGILARIPDITVAGKTGTAQNPHGADHAWFVGYAPASDPEIVVSVVIENVGHGGTHAAPVAKAVIEKHLKKDLAPAPDYATTAVADD